MEYCFSYHSYPRLCLLKISLPAIGTRSVSAETPPFPGRGAHPRAIPTCHRLLGMSAWENDLVSSGILWLSSLQLHRAGSQKGSTCFRLPACSGKGSELGRASWMALTEQPLPLMSHSTSGLSLSHSPSHVCPSHQQHPLTIPPPMCEFSVSSSSVPPLCPCHRWGKPGHWGQAPAWAPWLLGKHTHPSSHLLLLLL